jgi:hypothetical protein
MGETGGRIRTDIKSDGWRGYRQRDRYRYRRRDRYIATGGWTNICSGERYTEMDDGQKIDRTDRHPGWKTYR